jgi:hypothetical protein
MKRSADSKAAGLLALAVLFFGVSSTGPAWCAKGPAPVKTVTLRVFHRVFHNFTEDDKVVLNKEFPIGDTDFTATIIEYVPDFAMVMGPGPHKVVSRTNEPNNPAFRIEVKDKGAVTDTTWAMLSMPPHFARNSLLAFQVRRIDFKGHSPIVNKDQSAPVMPTPRVSEAHGHAPTSQPAARPASGPASRPSGGQ